MRNTQSLRETLTDATYPDDEAHRLILCRSYDIKLQKNRRFWGKMYQIYPIFLKISTSDFARILPKSRARFLLQRDFSTLAVRF